jgi:hypothetical protein
MHVSAPERTCRAQRVCILSGVDGWILQDDAADASPVDASLIDVPLAHLGSYATSPSVKLRPIRSDWERSRVLAAPRHSMAFAAAASNGMFWHWIGDEYLSIYWMIEHWLGLDSLSTVAAKQLRVVVLERISAHATQLVGSVTQSPLLFLGNSDSEVPVGDRIEPVYDVCFDTLHFGPASRQLGGPGSKYVDAALLARFASFVARANGLPGVPIAVAQQSRHLLLFDYRAKDRRIVNVKQVEAAFIAQFQSSLDVRFANLAALARQEQLELLGRASIFIAVHGSSFANLLWLPSGARVLELFPYGFQRPTYEGICRKYLPTLHYERWQNPDRSAAVFDRTVLERQRLSEAEIAKITEAPQYDYRMSWAANFYWINQDTILPIDPLSPFMQQVSNMVNRLSSQHTEL